MVPAGSVQRVVEKAPLVAAGVEVLNEGRDIYELSIVITSIQISVGHGSSIHDRVGQSIRHRLFTKNALDAFFDGLQR